MLLPVRWASLQTLRRNRSYSSSVEHRVATAVDGLTDANRENVVLLLKDRCNALYQNNEAYVPPTEALSLWLRDLQMLHRQYEPSQLVDEVTQAYESGVAIASKQRQFELAKELTLQMQQMGLRPTERIHQYLIRNVALKLISRPKHTSLEDLRELLNGVNDDVWDREIMSILEREERPLQLKTDKEFALHHRRLIAGVESQLDECEHLLGTHNAQHLKAQRSTALYNEALRVYADNGVKLSRMLQLMITRDVIVDVETYEALLRGARWNEIPATLTQLLNSKLVEQLLKSGCATASGHIHRLWINSMKAIVYSSTERFNSLSASVFKNDVDQLRKVYLYVDKQLSSTFSKFEYATTAQYDDVYTMRIKAAAACGLVAPVKKLIDEYMACAPLTAERAQPLLRKEPFLAALEIFPWSLVDVLMLSREFALARADSRDVAMSPRVVEMQLMYERVMRNLNEAQKAVDGIQTRIKSQDLALHEDELRRLQAQNSRACQIVDEESRIATTIERRLNTVRVLKANQFLIGEHLQRADETVEFILAKLNDAGFDVDNDLDVAIKLMEQYMKCARHLDKRLTQRQKHASLHMMHRVFKQVNLVSKAARSGGFDVEDTATRDKLVKFFEHAVCAAVRFWCQEETNALIRQQQRLLGMRHLTAREYDQLIFQRVTSLDVQGAYSLLQEMHFAGMKPSQEAIHRIALGLLHERNGSSKSGSYSANRSGHEGVDKIQCEEEAEEEYSSKEALKEAADENSEVLEEADEEKSGHETMEIAIEATLDSELSELLNTSDRDAIEQELGLSDVLKLDGDDRTSSTANAAARQILLLGSDAPVSIEDLISFLQDWYNLYNVKPFGKTVVPVLAQLLEANNYAELRRLLQILESMKGGLTPATHLWLEKRLKRGGKTLDDLRIVKK